MFLPFSRSTSSNFPGEPPKTGTATVRIYTKNKNDEEPKFSQQVYTPNVDENAGPNTLVTTVVASDKDGDNVRFRFVGGNTTSGQFVIEEITGVIRLHGKAISLDRDKYELNVTALDDGACCPNGETTTHTSTAVVVVFITDVNDNKPVFKDCSMYNPKVEEGAPNGSTVIKVQATDEDKGVNGQVKYSIVQQPNQKGTKFTVDEETGQVLTNKVFSSFPFLFQPGLRNYVSTNFDFLLHLSPGKVISIDQTIIRKMVKKYRIDIFRYSIAKETTVNLYPLL